MVGNNATQSRSAERRTLTLWKWKGSCLGLESRVLLCHPLPGAFPRESITHPGLFAEKPHPFPGLRYMAVAPITALQHPIEGKTVQRLCFTFWQCTLFPPLYPMHIPRRHIHLHVHSQSAGVDLGEQHELPTLRGTLSFSPCPGGLETTPLHLFRALPVLTREASEGVWHAWPANHSVSFHLPDFLPRYCSPMMWLWGLGKASLGSWRVDRATAMLSPFPPAARALPALSPPHKLRGPAEIIYF